MPIQFRCRYCRQLLGISRSRAGSTVDCPACGRSLRVPQEHGSSQTPAPELPTADPALRDALEVLAASSAALPPAAPLPTPTTVHAPIPAVRTAAITAQRNTPPATDHTAALELLATLPASPTTLNPEESLQPCLLFNPESDAETTDSQNFQPFPGDPHGDTDPTLQTLASIAPQFAPSADIVPQPVRQTTVRRLTRRLITPLLVACAFAAGFYLRQPSPGLLNPVAIPATPDPGDLTDTASPPVAQQPGPPLISGKIYYQDASGAPRPDAGALLILVPRNRTSTWKLDPRPFRDAPDNPTHKALAAALTVLNVSFTTADATGSYSLPALNEPSLQLIAVSRHQLRNTDTPLSDSVRNAIETWFDSAAHLTGKLAASVQPIQIREATSVEVPVITFARQ